MRKLTIASIVLGASLIGSAAYGQQGSMYGTDRDYYQQQQLQLQKEQVDQMRRQTQALEEMNRQQILNNMAPMTPTQSYPTRRPW
jgi:hypothetical protein